MLLLPCAGPMAVVVVVFFEVTDHTTAADPVKRVQPVPEVVSPADNSRTSGETVLTSREVKTPRHQLPVPGPSSIPKREQSETLKEEYFYDYNKFTKDYFEYEQCDKDIIERGRLRENIKFWESIGTNDYVLDVIKSGYKVPFYTKPPRQLLNNNKSASY
ncbi:hypothetical protein DPMN_075869 [Dreissena polymorpha]|uniref:Uncharacterized protein n=1 Tax=Dreissena polymorpha TaxID=45954 RepID=A0A9D3YMJ9_DREPO|nr:hypothetical protein DPMN_075869 [Dreissena polymorpha]